MLTRPWRRPGRLTYICIRQWSPAVWRRQLLTLAIETSCDDTSVAILERHSPVVLAAPSINPPSTLSPTPPAKAPFAAASLHFHSKVTANNAQYGGIHPFKTAASHQENLASLIHSALAFLPSASEDVPSRSTLQIKSREGEWLLKSKPDFVTVTRGPGMRSSLQTGIDTAKGLALAWQVPLLGVNHMQAHALTPQLVSALEHPISSSQGELSPAFPFLSLLVSGGHTMLVHSKALTEHAILGKTLDIAVGDVLDKIARDIIPPEILAAENDVMYGRVLERYAFPPGSNDRTPGYHHAPLTTRRAESRNTKSRWDWSLPPPLSNIHKGDVKKATAFSFCGLGSEVKRICTRRNSRMEQDEKTALAREAMRVAFEHLGSRVISALERMKSQNAPQVDTLVVSGGVASNQFLRAVLRSLLDARGYQGIQLAFPPPELCTDNAAMIAWTGMEMYAAGWESDLAITATPKWAIDPAAEDGGIMGVGGWSRRQAH